MSNFSNRLNAITNFMAKSRNSALKVIDDLADEVAEHTVLILIYEDDESSNHWKYKCILPKLTQMRRANSIKTPSGKLSLSAVSDHLYSKPISEDTDLNNRIIDAISHYESGYYQKYKKHPPKYDIDSINKDNLRISIDAIYDDYTKYVSHELSEIELKDRMSKYYLYKG